MQCSHGPVWAAVFLAGCDRWEMGGVLEAGVPCWWKAVGWWQVTRYFLIPVMLPRGMPETT